MTNVTRNVITDLWPLYLSGDLSDDGRRLVEEFLAQDPEFAAGLERNGDNPLSGLAPPPLPPDHEMKTLQAVRKRLWGYPGLLQMAMLFSALAFARIVSDTSWDVSPRKFIITAAIAGAFWIAFFVALYRGRRVLVVRLR